jgi:hypothetical protein
MISCDIDLFFDAKKIALEFGYDIGMSDTVYFYSTLLCTFL